MKTNATKRQTEAQKRTLIVALLEDMSGCNFDAIQASRKVENVYGVDYDWHDFADALDYMVRCGLALENGSARRIDGFTQYTIS